MTPGDFELTPEELKRLESGPLGDVDEDRWRNFAAAIHEQVCKAYASGDITLERALDVMWSCSLGCRPNDRITLMALTGRRARLEPATKRKGRRSANPQWVRESAAALVRVFTELRPDEAFAPSENNGWTTPILEAVIDQLVTLGLCDRISTRTVYRWYLDSTNDTQSNSTSTA